MGWLQFDHSDPAQSLAGSIAWGSRIECDDCCGNPSTKNPATRSSNLRFLGWPLIPFKKNRPSFCFRPCNCYITVFLFTQKKMFPMHVEQFPRWYSIGNGNINWSPSNSSYRWLRSCPHPTRRSPRNRREDSSSGSSNPVAMVPSPKIIGMGRLWLQIAATPQPTPLYTRIPCIHADLAVHPMYWLTFCILLLYSLPQASRKVLLKWYDMYKNNAKQICGLLAIQLNYLPAFTTKFLPAGWKPYPLFTVFCSTYLLGGCGGVMLTFLRSRTRCAWGGVMLTFLRSGTRYAWGGVMLTFLRSGTRYAWGGVMLTFLRSGTRYAWGGVMLTFLKSGTRYACGGAMLTFLRSGTRYAWGGVMLAFLRSGTRYAWGGVMLLTFLRSGTRYACGGAMLTFLRSGTCYAWGGVMLAFLRSGTRYAWGGAMLTFLRSGTRYAWGGVMLLTFLRSGTRYAWGGAMLRFNGNGDMRRSQMRCKPLASVCIKTCLAEKKQKRIMWKPQSKRPKTLKT